MKHFLSTLWLRIRKIPSFMRRHWKATLITALVALPVLGIAFALFSSPPPEYVTGEAMIGNIRQTVEAVGEVTSERDLQLKFPTSGVVAQVYVKEGDKVTAGQRLGTLRAGSLSASVASAVAIAQAEEARLAQMQAGSRPEDIAIVEADVRSRQASLEVAKTSLLTAEKNIIASQEKLLALKRQLDTSLSGEVSATRADIAQQSSTIITSLAAIQNVFSDSEVLDAIIKYNPGMDASLKNNGRSAENAVRAASNASFVTYTDALAAIQTSRTAGTQAYTAVTAAYDAISTIPETSSFTASDRETHKAALATSRNAIQTALSSLDASANALRNAAAGIDTQIAAEESAIINATGTRDKAKSDIMTYQAAVDAAQAQLNLTRAGTRQQEVEAQAARVRQARADVARASATLSDTVLTAPVDGTITQVAIKVGEFTPVDAAVTMLGNSPFRVEMFVSEIDIPKVAQSQSGFIVLDAFPTTEYDLRVSEIDPAATLVDNVSKFRVKLDFAYPHDVFKIGMSGDATVITAAKDDVMTAPSRAILENDDGETYVRVLLEDGTIEERTVVAGLEGDSETEIIDGLAGGETVIILIKE